LQSGTKSPLTDNIASQTIIAGSSYGPANELTAIAAALSYS